MKILLKANKFPKSIMKSNMIYQIMFKYVKILVDKISQKGKI